jgi:L-ascorbate metabolism protein UlaG (beta-lactamase superfamily)
MADRLRWLGHSTVLLDLDGVRVLTDPLLRRRVLHLRRAAPLALESLETVEAVLLSHVHHDHLDLPSLRLLGRETTVLAPRGAGRLLARHGFVATELSAGEQTALGSLSIRAVRADHPGRRALGATADVLGYVIAGSQVVYFAGDTDLFPEMAEIADRVDVALLPIWGWGPRLGPGHLDPESAAEALALVRPRLAVPIHWGTYYPLTSLRRSPPAFLAEPLERFRRAAAERAPAVDVRVLPVGGSLDLSPE